MLEDYANQGRLFIQLITYGVRRNLYFNDFGGFLVFIDCMSFLVSSCLWLISQSDCEVPVLGQDRECYRQSSLSNEESLGEENQLSVISCVNFTVTFTLTF